MSVSAPREALQVVAFETTVYKAAIRFLRASEHAAAADALEAEFVRPGRPCVCDFYQVVGSCRTWTPDPSGGSCRRCAHHKDCHRPGAPLPEVAP